MDESALQQALALLESDNESEALKGLKSVKGLLKEDNLNLSLVVLLGVVHSEEDEDAADDANHSVSPEPDVVQSTPKPIEASGMPQCHVPQDGQIEIIPAHATSGEIAALTGEAASAVHDIAEHLKDAIAVSLASKSPFKLKLRDVQDAKGNTLKTVLEAQYQDENTAAVEIWSGIRGEVANAAKSLRTAIKKSLPDLAA